MLVSTADLAALLGRPVPEQTADTAVRLAEADLRPLVRSREWPTDRSECDDLWGPTLRLAALYVDNPLGMRSTTSGGATDEWGVSSRAEILADVAARYGAAAGPISSFPPARAWPGEVTHR